MSLFSSHSLSKPHALHARQRLFVGLFHVEPDLRPLPWLSLAGLAIHTTTVAASIQIKGPTTFSLADIVGLVARSVEGLEFRAIDGEPVHVFLMLISPESRADEHLATLRWISQMARDQDFVSFIRQAQTAEAVLDVLQERAP